MTCFPPLLPYFHRSPAIAVQTSAFIGGSVGSLFVFFFQEVSVYVVNNYLSLAVTLAIW